MNKNYCLVQKLLLCAFLSLGSTSVHAQLTPDNTLGTEASKLTPNVLINGASADLINGGALRGSNLFHSFSEFNIKDGQRVYFANPSGVVNILTRVTGSNASSILGTLGVDGAANLFLINPNGILFGQNARLDIGGSFVGTTANGVQFGNQGNFSATNAEAPGLLTINPSALFFNQINPLGGIQNNSVAPVGLDPTNLFDVFGLRVPDGKSLLLVGGNVNMDGGQLNAYGGRVELGGVLETGNINLLFDENNLRLEFPAQVTRATVALTNQATVYAPGAGGGDIVINARNIEISGESRLFAGISQGLGTPETFAGDITLNAIEEIKVADSGSGIGNLVGLGSKGNGGNIIIDAGSLKLLNGTRISVSTFGEGNAGNVTVTAKDTVQVAGADIFSTVEEGGIGKGGNININAATLSLADGARISASTLGQGDAGNVIVTTKDAVQATDATISSTVEAGGVGKGGNIDINAATLSLNDIAQLQTATRGASDTQPAGRGDAGNVNVKVTGVVNIADKKDIFPSGIISSVEIGTVGNGGNITIDAGSLKLRDGARLDASTSGQGNAGNVRVIAKDAVFLTGGAFIFSTVETGGVGKGGNIDINAATLSLADDAEIATAIRGASDIQGAGKGDAGDITIDTGSLKLQSGASLVTSTYGQGNAGNVKVSAKDAVFLTNNSLIVSTVEAGGVGKGGNIDINATSLTLQDGVKLLTATRIASDTQPPGKGNAGNVNLNVTDVVDILGAKNEDFSGIFSRVETGTEGNGGNITIEAGFINLRDWSALQASTYGQGNAGNLKVSSSSAISLTDEAYILSTVEPGGVGKGGNIDINAATLSLQRGAQLLTITRGASGTQPAGKGDAGNVNVNVTGVVDIAGVATKNGFPSSIGSVVDKGTAGNGGNITIDAGSFKLQDGALLAASTLGQGNAGVIKVNASDFFTISGKSDSYISGIFVTSGSTTGNTGNIGDAGNIIVTSPKITLDNQGLLAADSASGSGGNINLNSDLLLLRRGAQISTNAGTEQLGGDGGNIGIDSRFIVSVPNENSDVTANAFAGKGGNVNIRAQGIFGIEPRLRESPETSDITASSQRGVQGEVSITEPDVEPEQGLIELPEEVIDATRRVAQICPREPGAKPLGEFTITGRGSLPPSPLEPLPGATNTTKLATLDNNNTNVSNTAPNKVPNAIVEAQGLVKNDDGSFELVAVAPQTTLNARVIASACPTN